MNASAIRQKLGKAERAATFNPTRWSEVNDGSGVPAGKLQVLEKFFTPVQQAKKRKERAYVPLQGDSLDDRFSTHSSSSSTSASALWSSEARLEKDALRTVPSPYHSPPSQSCREITMRGQSMGAGHLPPHQGHQELQPWVSQPEGTDQNFYKATNLGHCPVFSEEAEIPAMQQPPQTGLLALGQVVLRNEVAEEDGQLWKTMSNETIMEWPTRTKAPLTPRPRSCQKQEEHPSPKGLDPSLPKKPLVSGKARLIEEKLRFSEFLNEVTQQVMSPSSLISLGWKPPVSSLTNSVPSTVGSNSKSISSESLLEKKEGKRSLHRRKRIGQLEAKGDTTPIRPGQPQANLNPARTPDETSSSSESGLLTHFLANLSLPELSEDAHAARRDNEVEAEYVLEAKAQERSFKKAEEMVPRGAERRNGQEWRKKSGEKWADPIRPGQPQASPNPARTPDETSSSSESGLLTHFLANLSLPELSEDAHAARRDSEELLAEANKKPSMSPREQELPTTSALDPKSISAQQDLQKNWEEALKEKFNRVQEEYSNTRRTNQLLEEKLQMIVQSMAEERRTWNQRICELERLIRVQNVISTSEKINVSGKLPKSSIQPLPGEKSPTGLYSQPLLDVVPPPPSFKDGASSTRSSPDQGDLATELSLEDCEALGPPAEQPSKAAKSCIHAPSLTPWKSTKFGAECVNATEDEHSRKEMGPVCPSPAPCFLYLQEALAPPPTASSVPAPELVVFEMLHPPSLASQPASEHPAQGSEWSRWGRSDHGEISRSPGLAEEMRSHLDHQPRPKKPGSCGLSPGRSGQETNLEKMVAWPGPHCVAVHEEGGEHRSYQDLPSPGKKTWEGKACPSPQHLGGMVPQVTKGGGRGRQSSASAQDSTAL